MGEHSALLEISFTIYGDVDGLDLLRENDEDPENIDEEDPEEFEEKLKDMSHYLVEDIDRFFEVYTGFDADDEEDIREAARDTDLIVFQDGAVFWGDGEHLIDGYGELMNEESFSAEAEASDAEVQVIA
ncbi:hypothetical protein ES702_03205 [subsurface metagenome]